MTEVTRKIERVQLGVRREAHLVKVLRGLAECQSGKAEVKAVENLKKISGLDYDVRSTRGFPEQPAST